MEKTIVAISTPIGTGGVAIIRLSGNKSVEIAKKMCEGIETKKLEFLEKPRYMQLCHIKAESFKDSGLAVFFKAPNSFTGEDLIEFHVHGGLLLTEKILEQCFKLGAVLAGAGEFSKRAFLNGKISLDEAEGIIDLINSQSETELAAGEKLANGCFYQFITKHQDTLKNNLAGINMLIDYPSENPSEEDEFLEQCLKNIKKILVKLEEVYNTYKTGKIIKSGIDVAICGKPNAGKSSVLNKLTATDSAIVTDIPGTTRDIIKETFIYGGLKFNLHDTAGLRDTDNVIERIGITKAKEIAKNCDILLYVIDGSLPIKSDDLANLELFSPSKLIVILNKSDLISKSSHKEVKHYSPFVMSTLNIKDIEKLKEIMLDKVKLEKIDTNQILLTNLRHAKALKDAIEILKDATKAEELPLDITAQLFQSAYNKLGEITGEVGSDEIISEIFKNFCVGK